MDFVKGLISFCVCFVVGWIYGKVYLSQESQESDS